MRTWILVGMILITDSISVQTGYEIGEGIGYIVGLLLGIGVTFDLVDFFRGK